MSRPRIFRLQGWIALFAVLFATILPTLSHAFAPANVALDHYICTATGMVPVGGEVPEPGGRSSDVGSLQHCPFCAKGTVPVLPSRTAGIVVLALEAAAEYPSLFFTSPRPLFVWTRPHSRAPPSRA